MAGYLWNVIVNGLLSGAWFPQRWKPRVLRLLGADVHRSAQIRRRVDIYGPALATGEGVFVNTGSVIQNYARVSIGAHTQIGPRVTILTADHDIGGPEKRAVGLLGKPVSIGAGCWIGGGATILPGVTVRDGCIVAAGAVVTRECEPHGVYAGVPARRVRDLTT